MEESKSILHELYVFAEWKPEPEYLQKPDNILPENISTLWKWLKFFGPKKSLIDSVTAHKENQQKWHIALGDEGKVIAILADNILEIRTKRSEYATIAARTTVARDPYPQWRKLVWSPDCSFLALAYGNGVVSFFDLTASNLFNIPADCSRPGGMECTDNTHAVVDIIFMPLQVKDNKWSWEVALVTYDGKVRAFRVCNTLAGAVARAQLAPALSAVLHVPPHACLVAAAVPAAQDPNSPLGAGLTSWRILNDEPYYKLSVVSDQLETQRASKPFQMYIPFVARKNMTFIVEMALSPDMSKLVCLHCNGEVSTWSLPLLKLLYRYPLASQPQHDLRNPLLGEETVGKKDLGLFHPASVNWWSNDEIILSRFSGVVSVCNIKDMVNLLGKTPEFFQGVPRVTAAHHGGFMVLECECNIQPAKKSRSDENMEVVKLEEEDAEISMLENAKELVKCILYAITDMEAFQPRPRRVTVATRRYRLLGARSTTPRELLARQIESGNYAEALALAETFGLDSDQVYQQQWRKNPVSTETIENYLSKVSKKIWAVHQCVDRLPESLAAAGELLACGLRLTEEHVLQEINKDREVPITDPEEITVEDLNAYTSELLRCRHAMLFYKDRLILYEAILRSEKSSYVRDEYHRLRSNSIVHSAMELAKEGRIKALSCLWPQIKTVAMQLKALENIPETISPLEYQHLLPTKKPMNFFEKISPVKIPISDYENDWCRKDIFRSIWSSNWSEDQTTEPEGATIDFDELSKWYEKRAREIVERSGIVCHALALVTMVAFGGEMDGLESMVFNLLTLDTLIYDINLEDVTLSEVEKMTTLETCAALMSMSTHETFISDLKKYVVPYLKRFEVMTGVPQTCLSGLMDYLESVSVKDLSYILLVLQSPKEFTLEVRTHLELAERCLYAYEGTEQLSMACDLLQTILKESDGSISESELVRRVGEMQRIVAASAALSARRVPATWRQLRGAARDSAVPLLQRAAASNGEKRTEDEWETLLVDLIDLQKSIFSCVSVVEIYEIYASALLSSGDAASIKLAGGVLTCSRGAAHRGRIISYDSSVELVSKAAKDYFNSASNLKDPALELARCCLQLIEEDNPEIREEIDLIGALHLLGSFGVQLLPIQVRLCEDKMALVEECMTVDHSAYNAAYKLLKLATLLRVAGDDEVTRESLVLTAVLTRALDAGSGGVTAALGAARRLADMRCAKAAALLARAAALPGASGLHAAALALLPPRDLPTAARAKLQAELENILESSELREHNPEMEKQQSIDEEFSDAITTPIIERKDWFAASSKPGKAQPLLDFLRDTIQNRFTSSAYDESSDAAPTDASLHVPEFYRSLYPEAGVTGGAGGGDFRYDGFSPPDAPRNALRALNCYYAQNCIATRSSEDVEIELLQQCAGHYLYRDTTFSVACLLRILKNAAKANDFINKHCSNVGLSGTSYATLINCNSSDERIDTYQYRPSQLAKITLKGKTASQEQRELIRACIEKLSGAGDGDTLKALGVTVNCAMFNSDPEYREALIYQAARSPNKELVLLSFSLADKYGVDGAGVWLEHAAAAAQAGLPYAAPPPRTDQAYDSITKELWPKLSGTDYNGLINYFNAIRTLDDKTTIHGLTPDAHVKLLKKVKACTGLDYKMLIAPASPEALSAHLVAAMSGAGDGMLLVARLLRRLPPPLAAPAPPAALQAAARAKALFQIPDSLASNKKWMQQYRQCASYFSKLPRQAIRDLMRAICLSDEGIRRIRGSTRALMLLQTVEYCEQELEHGTATSDGGEESWLDVAKQLTGWKEFLERLHSPEVQALVAKYLPDFEQEWIEIEKTGGEEEALVSALAPLWAARGPLAQLLPALGAPPPPAAAAAAAHCRPQRKHFEIFVEHLIQFHKEGTKWDDDFIQSVLETAAEHGLPPHQQIALLSLSDKNVVRETGDMMKVAKFCVELFQSEWQDCDDVKNIKEEALMSAAGRVATFRSLLANSGSWARRRALVDVLACWPATADENGRSLQCSCLQTLLMADCMPLVRLMLPRASLPPAEMRWLADNAGPRAALRVVAAMLLLKYPHYQDDIVNTLIKHKDTIQEQEIDEELVKDLLDAGMFIKLVPTPLYPAVTGYVASRAAAGEPSPAYSAAGAVDQLLANNYLAEAGHLYLTSIGVPPPLLGFSQTVQYARNLLKK